MHDPPSRQTSSRSDLSWSAVAGIIAAGVLALVALVVFLNVSAKPPEPKPEPRGDAFWTEEQEEKRHQAELEKELARLQEKVRDLEQRRAQAVVYPADNSPKTAQESRMERAVEAAKQVEVSSGPFVKSGSSVAQVSFTLTNPGSSRTAVPLTVKLFRDGEEVSSKSMMAAIGPEQSLAYSVLLQTAGPGSYAAEVDLALD
jgi:hypothetical protein